MGRANRFSAQRGHGPGVGRARWVQPGNAESNASHAGLRRDLSKSVYQFALCMNVRVITDARRGRVPGRPAVARRETVASWAFRSPSPYSRLILSNAFNHAYEAEGSRAVSGHPPNSRQGRCSDVSRARLVLRQGEACPPPRVPARSAWPPAGLAGGGYAAAFLEITEGRHG